MINDRIKVGVIGVGSLGQWHARIYSEIEDVELVGVFDTDENRANEIAEKYNTKPYTSIDELAVNIDAASVVVPTDIHYDIFRQLLANNVNMLMEKPIASTSEEAEKMVKMAEEKDILLQVGHVERFNPVMSFLEDNLSSPRFIEATRLAGYPPPREGGLPRGTEVSVVLDLMIHDLDIILHLMKSPVKSINATGVAVLSSTEDIANARINFENGCVANVTASRISQEKLRKLRVFQDDLYLSLDYMNQDGQLSRKTATGIETMDVPIEKDEPLAAELKSFSNCVKHRHDPVVTGQHGSDALRLAVNICEIIRNNPS